MTEKKELNNEELEKVTGGAYIETAGDKSAYSNYTVPVDTYAAQAGQFYLFAGISGKSWIYGELKRTFEYSLGCGKKATRHEVRVYDGQVKMNANLMNVINVDENKCGILDADNWKIYTK